MESNVSSIRGDSVRSVLDRALEQAEKYKHVVVLTVDRNNFFQINHDGNIDLATLCIFMKLLNVTADQNFILVGASKNETKQ